MVGNVPSFSPLKFCEITEENEQSRHDLQLMTGKKVTPGQRQCIITVGSVHESTFLSFTILLEFMHFTGYMRPSASVDKASLLRWEAGVIDNSFCL